MDNRPSRKWLIEERLSGPRQGLSEQLTPAIALRRCTGLNLATRCVILFAAVLTLLPARAQQQSPSPSQQSPASSQQPATAPQQSNPPSSPAASQDQKEKTAEQKSGTSNDRLFFALPNFLTVENANQVPKLTAKQKFKVVARSSFDYVEFPWYGVLAGISQAENSEPGYGQGFEGYAKRYGSAFADGTIENFWTSAILPSVFRQDPRFYQMPDGGFAHRAGYAMSRIFVTRGDSGRRQINISEILGSAIAATISTYSYHPQRERTIGNTASVWGSQVGYDTITIEVKEFWPDIRRKFRAHKHQPADDSATATKQ